MNDKEIFDKYFGGCNKQTLKEYLGWIKNNPMILQEFIRLAHVYRDAGNKKCSGWLLANVIRWNQDIAGTDEQYKIKNLYIAFLTRNAIWKNPELDGFLTVASWRLGG